MIIADSITIAVNFDLNLWFVLFVCLSFLTLGLLITRSSGRNRSL